jgi:tRNA 2-selenouridine synthase
MLLILFTVFSIYQFTFAAVPEHLINIEDFIASINSDAIIIDARSPIEFNYAHIPSAINIPIFNNDERAIIGTAYKQQSREKAIALGLKFFGNQMQYYLSQINNAANTNGLKIIYLHCARGGMRSEALSHLFSSYGYTVKRLIGGYKSYRNWVLQQFEKDYNFKIIGGRTGSGKTDVLHELLQLNAAVIDLEGIANHKGSAFGSINMPPQPKQEMWENKLAKALFLNRNELIFIEDESQRIGNLQIPNSLWKCIREKQLLYLDVPLTIRHTNIIKDYGHLNLEELINAVQRISKKLGGLDTKNIIQCLHEKNIELAFGLLLTYYDKQYDKATNARENIKTIKKQIALGNFEIKNMAQAILNNTHNE